MVAAFAFQTSTTAHSYNELVLPNRHDLLGFAMKLCRSREDAEDLVQDTLIKALRFWDSFSPASEHVEKCCRGWLFRILHNTFNSKWKAATYRFSKEATMRELIIEASYGSPEDGMDPRQTLDTGLDDEFQSALDQLDPSQRDVMMRFANGQPYKEIAEACGIPIGTVMSRLFRGRKKIAMLLGRTPLPLARVDADRLEPTEDLEAQTDGVDSIVAGDDGEEFGFGEAGPDADASW